MVRVDRGRRERGTQSDLPFHDHYDDSDDVGIARHLAVAPTVVVRQVAFACRPGQ